MMRALSALRIGREKALVSVKTDFRLVSSTASQSASLMRINRPSRVTPALLTRMLMPPVSSRILATAASTAAVSPTSTATAQLCRPSAVISSATFCELASVRERHTTLAPASASFSAMARPMPRPAPVTTAVKFSRDIVCES